MTPNGVIQVDNRGRCLSCKRIIGDTFYTESYYHIDKEILEFENIIFNKIIDRKALMLSKKIDDNLYIFIKHKPWYMPEWLY